MIAPDPEFLEIFRDEASTRLDQIVDALLALEKSVAEPGALDGLFRDVHTIKGAAGMVGLEQVRRLAHAMEDVLADARDQGSLPVALVDPLLRSADEIRRHVEGGDGPTDELAAELQAARGEAFGPAEPDRPRSAAEPVARGPERRSIRVPADKLDGLLDLVGETVLHRRRLEHALGSRAATNRAIADELDAGERLLGELKESAVGMRTVPLSSIVAPLPRALRDLAADAGKQAELVVVGVETELDRAILEGLSEPLVHLLRNAVAHGIERPVERELAGKPPVGRVTLRAEQRGAFVEVTVADDGRGVGAAAVAEAAGGTLTEVLTRPGYSTAETVSGVSGRGVGLDAVRAQVESFGGELGVSSVPGEGTSVVMRLPLALALMEVLLVERGGTVYGFPLASVEEAVAGEATLSLAGRRALELRGSSVPLADLAELLGAEAEPPRDRPPVVVLAASGRRFAFTCDRLLGEEEVVVKSLGPLLARLRTYLGAAILGDGRVALLVDPGALVGGSRPVSGRATRSERPESAAPSVLVVEDSLAIRELQRGILETAGYRVQTATDGVDALAALERDRDIELVVTDIEMPQMDGLELTRSIRADPDRSALPVVIVSSMDDDADRRRGIDAGADAYMVKRAFDQKELLETVERLVGR